MKLNFADVVVPVKMLKIGTVVYDPNDLNSPSVGDSFPCHVVGFVKVCGEIWLRIKRNDIEVSVDPKTLVYGVD